MFNKHANFDVESLDSEVIRKEIRISLLQEMLRKKPHYAKHFTELEEDLNECCRLKDLVFNNLKNAPNECFETLNYDEIKRNRISSVFNKQLN